MIIEGRIDSRAKDFNMLDSVLPAGEERVKSISSKERFP